MKFTLEKILDQHFIWYLWYLWYPFSLVVSVIIVHAICCAMLSALLE